MLLWKTMKAMHSCAQLSTHANCMRSRGCGDRWFFGEQCCTLRLIQFFPSLLLLFTYSLPFKRMRLSTKINCYRRGDCRLAFLLFYWQLTFPMDWAWANFKKIIINVGIIIPQAASKEMRFCLEKFKNLAYMVTRYSAWGSVTKYPGNPYRLTPKLWR